MIGKLKPKPPTRRDVADHVALKMAGVPAHINPREDAYLKHALPEAAGKVITRGLLAEAGTDGDDRVTLLTAQERARLKHRGGSGDRNPNTGLLQYGDGMGGSDNPGGGHNGDQGPGSPGGGGYGPGSGTTDNNGNYSSNYSAGVGYGFSPSPATPGLSYGDISNFGGIGMPGAGPIGPRGEMDAFAGRPGALTNYGLEQEYAPRDTLKRLAQTALWGPPKQYNPEHVKGRAPTGQYPGLAQRAATTLAGPVGFGFNSLMNLGGWMRDSMSPETQAASMKENQEQGAKNSTGRDNDSTAQPSAQAAAPVPLALADTTSAPGYVITPDGRVSSALSSLSARPGRSDRTLSGLPQPVQNLLIDYLWSRQGKGLLG